MEQNWNIFGGSLISNILWGMSDNFLGIFGGGGGGGGKQHMQGQSRGIKKI